MLFILLICSTDLLWAFGQFLNHDITRVEVNKVDACNINVPPNDPFLGANVTIIPMSRSHFALDSNSVAQQLNDLSSFLDAENVYGDTTTRLNYIRSDDSSITGRLRTSNNNLLPKNVIGLSNRGGDDRDDLFVAGDVRANENLALTVAHTLWVREHNYWADNIRALEPSLDGDTVFEMARTVVRAELQKIVFDEFLPSLIGEDAIPPYEGYKSYVDPRLENIVTACAFRFHSMVGPSLLRNYGNGTSDFLPLEETFFSPSTLEGTGGIDPFLRGLTTNVCEDIDPFMVSSLRNHLFSDQHDLMAINVERARDHGLPDFNTIRESLGFEKLSTFDDFLFSQELASVYSDTDQIDCWVGMNSEPHLEGLMVGPTQRAVLARNFANLRDGDKYFYKNLMKDPELLEMIESTTLANVIRRNSDFPHSLDDVQDNVFFAWK